MSLEVTMPQMGESVVEGTVTKWLVKAGDRVSEDQPLCEISTDKVDTEIPSPGSGIIARLLASEGQTLPVGAALAVIESGSAAAQVPARQSAPAASAPAPAEPAPQTPSVATRSPAHPRQQPVESVSVAARPRPQAPDAGATAPSPPRRYSLFRCTPQLPGTGTAVACDPPFRRARATPAPTLEPLHAPPKLRARPPYRIGPDHARRRNGPCQEP